MTVFWVVAIALMMEAVSTSEILVNFYQTTQRNNTEDSHLHTHCCENVKASLCSPIEFGVSFVFF
jgi:hypothetical protein